MIALSCDGKKIVEDTFATLPQNGNDAAAMLHARALDRPEGALLRLERKINRFRQLADSTGFRVGCLLALALLLPASLALAGDEAHVYDAQGRYQGRATTDTANPKQKSLYDAKGRYIGRVMTDGNGNARVYDQHGKYQGRVSGWQTKTSSNK